MADFRFLQVPGTKTWVILDPNRSKRPNVGHKAEQVCPFCVGNEVRELELYREGGVAGDHNWKIRVIQNKFPFASIHEIVVHSPDHHKNFEELPVGHIELILRTYRQRYRLHRDRGQVYIFHNRGIGAGESIPHPHSQIAVVPYDVPIDAPPLDLNIYRSRAGESPAFAKASVGRQSYISNLKTIGMGIFTSFFSTKNEVNEEASHEFIETENFLIFCPLTSQWSDEVWIAPKAANRYFGDIIDREIEDLAFCLQRLINILDLRHGHEFPFNFYIYPGNNWYLRIIPRYKILGGFEMGTGIIVNTQNPVETFAFLKEHFFEENLRKIRMAQQADYWKSV